MRHLAIAILLLTSISAATAGTVKHFSERSLVVPAVIRTESYHSISMNSFGVEKPMDSACARTTAPIAIDTPNPVLTSGGKVVVSLVVGWDGKVYTPFMTEAVNDTEDRTVLHTLASWRFRPATCNGTPVNAEGQITFHQ